MDQSKVRYLFQKYLDNQCSEEELQVVLDLLKSNRYDKLFHEVIHKVNWDNLSGTVDATSLENVLNQLNSDIQSQYLRARSQRPWMYKVAASVILLISAFIAYALFFNTGVQEYHTQFGETRVITLPDHSVVTLNANSNLRFQKDWSNIEQREVRLEGEAYFDIVKDSINNKKFIVKTEDMSIEVLGTQFNVQNRNDRTQVVLNSGKVKVKSDAAEVGQELTMVPGDLVELDKSHKTLIKRKVDANNFSSWKENKLVFESTPLSEIKQRLQEIHGIQIEFKDLDIATNQFTGTYPMDDYMIVVKVLAETYNLSYQKEGSKIILRKR